MKICSTKKISGYDASMAKEMKKRERGRPKIDKPKSVVVRARVEKSLYERLEAFRKAEKLGTESDALRVAIERLPM